MSENKDNLINLTPEQTHVYNKLIEFVKSDTERELLLIGYAGTGKTTMMAKFINDLIHKKICKKIVMAAPTHKAVNIAKSKLLDSSDLEEEQGKSINIMTIHRLLNYQSYINSDNGDKYFARGKIDPNWTIYNLIVLDECSMLSNQIIGDIKLQMENQANSKIKIIYVGDPAQLPPVNQSDSKIFNSGIKSLSLDKIIRTSNQKIMELSNDHRKWIASKKMEDIPHVGDYQSDNITVFSTENKEVKAWLDDFLNTLKSTNSNKSNPLDLDNANNTDNTNTNNLMNQIDHDTLIKNHNNNIILTWTNRKCNLYNQYIREKFFNKKDLAHWEIGEILIFADFHRKEIIPTENNENNDDNGDNKKEFISFYTSEQIKLIGLAIIKYKYLQIKFKTNSNITQELNDIFKKYIGKINKLIDFELDVYDMKVQRIIDLVEKKTIIPEYNILSIHEDSEKKHNSLGEEFEKIIIKIKTKCYDKINKSKLDNMGKTNLQSEVEKKINKLYRDWQANVIDCFAQLNYGYSITVHKAQGSTFFNVYIDISDILDNNNINETSKCLYTSITRSSSTLKLLI